MASVEDRLKAVEDRLALQDVVNAYCAGVDSLGDMDGLLNCFTEDALLDLSGLDLPCFQGHAGIREFFGQVFDDMAHHAHYATNITIDRIEGDAASGTCYVIGMGDTLAGRDVLAHVKYFLDFTRTPNGWKIAKFGEAALMPLPDSVTGIHGRD